MKKGFEKLIVVMMCSLTLSACNKNTGHKHNYGALIPEVEPTCVEDGVAAHYHCQECDKYFDTNKKEVTRESLTIQKLGHVDGEEWYEESG